MNQTSRKTNFSLIVLLLIMLFGAFFRVNASLHTQVDTPLRSDASKYFSYAFNLRHSGVYSPEPRFATKDSLGAPIADALCSPGYPIALLPFAGEIPTDRTILNITLMQALLGILMIPLTYLIARRATPEHWALLPTALVAISPQLINMGVYILSESLFSFLMLLAIYCMTIQFEKADRISIAVISGILVGAAALTRPTLQYLLPFIFIGVLPLLPGKIAWRHGIGMTFGFLAIYIPWIIRNIISLGIVTDQTLSITTIVHGHYPNFMFLNQPDSLGYPYRFDPQITELSSSMGAALSGIWQRVLESPWEYIEWYLVGKPLAFFAWGDVASAGDIFTYPTLSSPYYGIPLFTLTKGLMGYLHYILVALALIVTMAFVIPSLRNRIKLHNCATVQLLVCILVYFLAIHTVGFPIARYCVPLLPVIFLLATYGIVTLLKHHALAPASR